MSAAAAEAAAVAAGRRLEGSSGVGAGAAAAGLPPPEAGVVGVGVDGGDSENVARSEGLVLEATDGAGLEVVSRWQQQQQQQQQHGPNAAGGAGRVVPPDDARWREVCPRGDTPPARHCHSVVYDEVGQRCLMFGGYGRVERQTVYFSDVWAFDLATERWSWVRTRGAPPVARHSHTAVLHDQRMWVYGGIGAGANTLDDCPFLDLKTLEWRREVESGTPVSTAPAAVQPHTLSGQRPAGRWGHSAVVASLDGEEVMLVFGGYADTFKADFHALSFKRRAWRQVQTFGSLVRGRQFHAAAVVGRSMYVVGGFAGAQNVADAFRFHLDTHTLSLLDMTRSVVDRRGHTLSVLRDDPHTDDPAAAAAAAAASAAASAGASASAGADGSGAPARSPQRTPPPRLVVIGGKSMDPLPPEELQAAVTSSFSAAGDVVDESTSVERAQRRARRRQSEDGDSKLDADGDNDDGSGAGLGFASSDGGEAAAAAAAAQAAGTGPKLRWTALDASNTAGDVPVTRHFHAAVAVSPTRVLLFSGFGRYNKNDVIELALAPQEPAGKEEGGTAQLWGSSQSGDGADTVLVGDGLATATPASSTASATATPSDQRAAGAAAFAASTGGVSRGVGFASLVASPLFADVELRAEDGGAPIPAHRAVLFALSERFASLLLTGGGGGGGGGSGGSAAASSSLTAGGGGDGERAVVDVPHVPRRVLLVLLRWVYSGGVRAEVGSADDLVDVFRAADAFLLPTLRETCEKWLVHGVDPANAASLAALAEQHGATRLASRCATVLAQQQKKQQQQHGRKTTSKTET